MKRRYNHWVLPVLTLSIGVGILTACHTGGDRPTQQPAPSIDPTPAPALTQPDDDATSDAPTHPAASPEPTESAEAENTGAIALTCSGTIQDGPDFTAYYTSDGGFSKIEFGPSDHRVVSDLDFSEQNDKGQTIWRGSAFDRADVTLVALSSDAMHEGNQVSVSYDTRWGRATCIDAQATP